MLRVILTLTIMVSVASAADTIQNLPTAATKRAGLLLKCTECHRHVEPNGKVRKLLGDHTEIDLKHGHLWCMACHDLEDKTLLRLREGKALLFQNVEKLCGECHGLVYRDWKLGIHGKRTGHWNGAKNILICTACHNAHTPKFQPMAPKAPPVNRFHRSQKKEGTHHE